MVFDSYSDIFELRGRLYDDAMQRCPHARDQEFDHAVAWSGARAGERVCDAPSGGGYLARHVPAGVRMVHFETSPVFARLCRAHGARDVVVGSFDALPLATGCASRVVGIAGLHHVERKAGFFEEARRILGPAGVLCVADAAADSPVAEFLDGFVHEHSSMGHRGAFLDGSTAAQIERCGFVVERAEVVRFEWCFADEEQMAHFVRDLFGLDRAEPDRVVEGITRDPAPARTRTAVRCRGSSSSSGRSHADAASSLRGAVARASFGINVA